MYVPLCVCVCVRARPLPPLIPPRPWSWTAESPPPQPSHDPSPPFLHPYPQAIVRPTLGMNCPLKSARDFLEEIPENSRKTPEMLSEISWHSSPRECGWEPPSPMIQGIWSVQQGFPEFSPLSTVGDVSFSEIVPKRAFQSVWVSELVMNSQQYWGYSWLLAWIRCRERKMRTNIFFYTNFLSTPGVYTPGSLY